MFSDILDIYSNLMRFSFWETIKGSVISRPSGHDAVSFGINRMSPSVELFPATHVTLMGCPLGIVISLVSILTV